MKSKRRIAILLISFVLLIALVLVVVALTMENRIESNFPMWKESVQYPTNPDVKMEFVGIDFDVRSDPSLDEILVRVKNLSGEQVSYGEGYSVEYLYGDKWYTVFSPGAVPAVALTLGSDEVTKAYEVTSGLFEQSGKYRIYVDQLGYCEIEMEF